MLQTLVLSVTYNCPIRCRCCGVNAGPHRTERMSIEFITRIIEEAGSLGTVEVIVFTGGEPFVLGEDLYSAVEYAAERGFKTRIVTNGYWATSLEKARAVLARLKATGLTEINYSCDDFHQEHIPLERIRWANEAALAVGMPALLAVKGLKGSRITPEYMEEFFGRKLTRFRAGVKNPDNDVFNYGVTVPVGWGRESLSDEELLWPEDDRCWQSACESVLKNIVITPSGELAICCGIGSEEIPEVVVGSVREKPLVELLIEANNDLIINWLALEGPYGILEHVRRRAPEIRFRDRYVNACHLCHDVLTRGEVRAVLSETAEEVVPVLGLERAWVENHRADMHGREQQ